MLNVGDHVIYVDSTAHHRHALVTAIHGCRSIEDRVEQEKKFQASEMVQADKAGYYTPEVLARRLEAAQTAPLLMPSINVVVVASEEDKTDPYGRQLDTRFTSVPHREQQAAHGYYWYQP